jgi:hypothetical protein
VSTADIARDYLLYFILPLWIAAGIADWLCHRHAHIESNAGPKESLIHLMMLGEAGTAVLAGLWFTVNSAVILLMLVAWALHEVTAMWDLVYANGARAVSAIEQKVHDYLGVVPLLALSLILVIHWGQFLAIFGLGDDPADWSFTPRSLAVSPVYFWSLMAVMVVNFLMYLEELRRGLRFRSSRRLYRTGS